MTKKEWVNRCARRLRKLDPGFSERLAELHATALAQHQFELHGESGLAWQAPEDAADESDALAMEDDA